jgi:hypothetical protein
MTQFDDLMLASFSDLSLDISVQPPTIADLANAPLSDDVSDIGSETGTSTLSNDSQKENPNNRPKDKQRRWSLGRRSSSKKLHQEWCESEYIVWDAIGKWQCIAYVKFAKGFTQETG